MFAREGRPPVLPVVFLAAIFASLLVLAQTPPSAAPSAGSVEACEPCHSEIVRSFKDTSHHNASRPASPGAILGDFDPGRNLLRTQIEGVYFKMEQRPDGFYQTGHDKGRTRAERFDLVIGSGRRGQSYLYWKGQLLFQLPVSYLKASESWVNSPGYPDGAVHFDRPIPPRCLECHATYFRFEGTFPNARYGRDHLLGITCRRCHGAGPDHLEIRNPARLERDQQVDTCALCHSGIRESRQPLYSFRPGDDLAAYLEPEAANKNARPDVHGNQVGLLRRSRCFSASPDMSCSTCHNVHRNERNIGEMSQKCQACHQPRQCKLFARVGTGISERCVDCHMPSQQSRVISIHTPGKTFFQSYRTHTIGVYKGIR